MKTSVISSFLSLLSIRDKIYFFLLILLTVVVSIVEIFSLSMVIPFLALVNNSQLIIDNKYLNFVYVSLSFTSPLTFLLLFGILLVLLIVFRGFINIFYVYLLTKFSRTRYRTLSFKLFEKYLGLNYVDYIKQSSSFYIHNILNESLSFTSFLYAFLVLFSEIMTISIIYILLILFNWKITISLSIGVAIVSFLIIKIAKPLLNSAGNNRIKYQTNLMKILNDFFGNYKYIKILTDKNYFKNRFYYSASGFVKADAVQGLFQVIPRIIMETGGICVLLIVLLYTLFLYKNTEVVVAILTLYAIAFFRLIPSVSRIIVNWGYLMYFKNSINKVALEMKRSGEILGQKQIVFSKSIEFKDISFCYEKDKPILNNINLMIKKGCKLAIVGPSGCGKSTFVDLLSGLLKVTSGTISIDGVLLDQTNLNSWRKNIGYIPQNIYLFEGTVKDNVVCGREEDDVRVINALKMAKIYDFLLTKEGINTLVGDNGVLLSGGQKQRIGIARALYDNPSVLILDEATSALDKTTENDIIHEILEIEGDITIIIITHREYFLKNCDMVYRMCGMNE